MTKTFIRAVFALLLLSCPMLMAGCAGQKAARSTASPAAIEPAAGTRPLPATTDEARGATY